MTRKNSRKRKRVRRTKFIFPFKNISEYILYKLGPHIQLTPMWHEDVPQIIASRDVIGWFSHGRLCPFTSAPITPIKIKFYFKEEQANPQKTQLFHTQVMVEYPTLSPQIKIKVYLVNECYFIKSYLIIFLSQIHENTR